MLTRFRVWKTRRLERNPRNLEVELKALPVLESTGKALAGLILEAHRELMTLNDNWNKGCRQSHVALRQQEAGAEGVSVPRGRRTVDNKACRTGGLRAQSA